MKQNWDRQHMLMKNILASRSRTLHFRHASSNAPLFQGSQITIVGIEFSLFILPKMPCCSNKQDKKPKALSALYIYTHPHIHSLVSPDRRAGCLLHIGLMQAVEVEPLKWSQMFRLECLKGTLVVQVSTQLLFLGILNHCFCRFLQQGEVDDV